MTSPAPALCDVCVDKGRTTALVAIGICNRCDKAYCPGHRALGTGGVPYSNFCTSCQTKDETAKKARATAEYDRQKEQMTRITELIQTLGSRGLVERSGRRETSKTGLFRARRVTTVHPLDSAWPVGELKWKTPGNPTEAQFMTLASGITPAGEIVPMNEATGYLQPSYGWAYEALDGFRVLERSESVRQQVIQALEQLK